MADTFGHLIASFKGRHRDAILVIGEVLLQEALISVSSYSPLVGHIVLWLLAGDVG